MTRPIYIFVGECLSLTAIRKGWSWKDGRLAAKPLFEALVAMGIDPAAQHYINVFRDPTPTSRALARHAKRRGKRVAPPKIDDAAITGLLVSPWVKVALGKRVSAVLTDAGIDHVALVHPAARGKIRRRDRYIAHVKEHLDDSERRKRQKADDKQAARDLARDARGEIEG